MNLNSDLFDLSQVGRRRTLFLRHSIGCINALTGGGAVICTRKGPKLLLGPAACH